MQRDNLTTSPPSPHTATTRRGLLAGLAAGALAITPNGITARKRRKQRKKRKNRDVPRTLEDAQCLQPNNGVAVESEPDGRIAQTFTAIRSGELVRADLLLTFTTDTPDDFVLHLAPLDAFGFPTNQVLAAATLAATPSPTGDATVQTFTFQKPGTVVAGTTYALVLSRPEVGTERWEGHFGDACPGRAFKSIDRSAPFTKVGFSADLIFTTFVRG
jgi:hypothetical protein